MSVQTRKGPIVDPGQCRCCGASKKCRLLNVEYEWFGQKEIYADMFFDTFGLLLSNLDGEAEERLICATCVTRLRDAGAFRRQVLQCEERLLQSKLQPPTDCEVPSEFKQEDGDLKEEADCASSLTQDDHDAEPLPEHDNEINDIVLVKGEPVSKSAKKPKKEKKPSKAKKKVKTKTGRESPDETLATIRREIALQNLQPLDEQPAENPVLTKTKPRALDKEYQAFRNTVTIVETSYVCPFDTSFSDYYCVYCRQLFTDPDKLRAHTLAHDPATFQDVLTNRKIPQIDVLRIDCRLCLEKIDDIDTLKSHITTVHGKILYEVSNEFLKFRLTVTNLTCTECNSTFSFFHALKKHMAEHFGTFICDVCGTHYFQERMLAVHQKTHQRVEEIYPCKDCGKTFKNKHSRYLHEASTHKKEPAYPCPKCDEVLYSYSLRHRHIIDVHGEERVYQCEHCDRSYNSRKSLREHNRRFHLKIFKHQCDLCDKRFYLPSRLKEHMATHTGERNYRCEYCGKSYPRLRGLRVHMQSHSADKRYACPLCSASFTQNVNLRNHLKRQHHNTHAQDYHE